MSVTWLMTVSLTASSRRNKNHLLVGAPKLWEGCNQPRGTDWILPSDGGDALQRNARSSPARRSGIFPDYPWTRAPDEPYWFMIVSSHTTLTLWLFKKTLLKASWEKNSSRNHLSLSLSFAKTRKSSGERTTAPARLRLLCNFMSSLAQWVMRLSSIWTRAWISPPPSRPSPVVSAGPIGKSAISRQVTAGPCIYSWA